LEEHFWQQGISPVAGVDETGMGAWAGPVITAAVILPCNFSLPGPERLEAAERQAPGGAV
jgi:ribonuclease HII